MIIPVGRWLLDTWFYWVPAALSVYWAICETVELIRG